MEVTHCGASQHASIATVANRKGEEDGNAKPMDGSDNYVFVDCGESGKLVIGSPFMVCLATTESPALPDLSSNLLQKL